jgi:hypothetical protein
MKPSHLRIEFKGRDEPVVNGELHKRIKVEDSTWYLEDGSLKLELSKMTKEEWWSCVCVGDVEIDTSKIQPEESTLADLPGESRGAVEKMMFDQRQKEMGLPTSDELKRQEMFKSFQENNPQLDFSQAQFMNE